MKTRTIRRLIAPPAVGLCAAWLFTAQLGAVSAQPDTPEATTAISRPHDPVIAPGASFPVFSGAPTSTLVLYAYRSGSWAPIPFQVDEVGITGTYVVSDGGLLDANDELVFMAGDAGNGVDTSIWPSDTQSRLYPRYAITVSDPLSPGSQAWVYLYRSPTLLRSNIRYITWTESAQTAAAISYTASFSPTAFIGLADLKINGGSTDILDRQKIRATAFFGTINLNEENIPNFFPEIPATVTLPVVGPVRAVSDGNAFYGSQLDIRAAVTFNVLSPDFIRTSFDWNDPSVTGIDTYRDSNTLGAVSIDGNSDLISSTPRVNWIQVNGGAAGPGGLAVAIPRFDPGGGSVTNYYKDDSALDPNDTGDKKSFADAGLRIDNPGAVISFTIAAYVLPPGATASVGAAHFARATNPLTIASAAQNFAGTKFIYLPVILK